MFDFVRQHKKIMQFLLVLLIFPSFVLFGIDGYNRFREKGAAVAVVDGQDITQAEWDQAHRAEVERVRASMPNIDVKMLDSEGFKYGVLERMVRDRVFQAAVDHARLVTSDAKLATELQQNPTIAALRRADGTLDMERYKQLLAAQSMSPEMFEARMRADLSVQQVMKGVSASAFAPPAQADLALNAWLQQREVQVLKLSATEYASQVKPSDADIRAYYDAHAAQFLSTERADVEYVVLDLGVIEKTIALNEADLKTYYQQNLARLGTGEERRASHILINAPQSASDADRAKAKALAESLLTEAQKAPQKFAELAKKHSQDAGSARKGGDLEFFARGAMVKPFEEAAFALSKGEISKLVETEFGYHIIQLTDIKSPKQKSFEEMRPSLETELRKQQAQRKFAEVAEQFTNLVYEQSDSLQPVVDRLKLQVQKLAGLTRQGDGSRQGVLSNPKVLAAVFSADSLDKKRNTEAIETAPNQLVSVRVTQYAAAKTLPLEEVKTLVQTALVKEKSATLAQQDGADKLAAWKKDDAAGKLPAALVLSRDKPAALPMPLLDAIYRAPSTSLPAWVGVSLGSEGYALARVSKVLPARADVDTAALRAQYAQALSAAESLSYFNQLRDRFKVQIKVQRPAAQAQAS